MGRFTELSNSIRNIQLIDSEDRWVWSLDGLAVYSTNSIKKHIEINKSSFELWDFAWDKSLPIKVNFFCWRALIDRLPAREAIHKQVVYIENHICPLCNLGQKTVSHILLNYNFSNMVRTSLSPWCSIPSFQVDSVENLLNHINTITTTEPT